LCDAPPPFSHLRHRAAGCTLRVSAGCPLLTAASPPPRVTRPTRRAWPRACSCGTWRATPTWGRCAVGRRPRCALAPSALCFLLPVSLPLSSLCCSPDNPVRLCRPPCRCGLGRCTSRISCTLPRAPGGRASCSACTTRCPLTGEWPPTQLCYCRCCCCRRRRCQTHCRRRSLLLTCMSCLCGCSIWIDMNEASNFCEGQVCRLRQRAPTNNASTTTAARPRSPPSTTAPSDRAESSRRGRRGRGRLGDPTPNCALDCQPAPAEDPLCHPPYAIDNQHSRGGLCAHDIPTSARHHDGSLQVGAGGRDEGGGCLQGLTPPITTTTPRASSLPPCSFCAFA